MNHGGGASGRPRREGIQAHHLGEGVAMRRPPVSVPGTQAEGDDEGAQQHPALRDWSSAGSMMRSLSSAHSSRYRPVVQQRNRGGGHAALAGVDSPQARVMPHHEPVERYHHQPDSRKMSGGR